MEMVAKNIGLLHLKSCCIKDTLRHKYTTMWQQCVQITQSPQFKVLKVCKWVSKTPVK